MARDPASSASGRNNPYLQRAYELNGPEATKDLYNEWATTYDEHVKGTEYASPQRAVEAVVANLGNDDKEVTILDAGCGTGLVGECFADSKLSGHFVLDGLDLTDGMLAVAREKGVYRDLEAADLTTPIKRSDESYDVVTCVGTLTKGHVGPRVFREFARVTKKGGIIVGTVHDDIWQSHGYEKEVQGLHSEKIVDIISTDEFGILKGSTEGGRMVILRKI